jgi:hypothetical protein
MKPIKRNMNVLNLNVRLGLTDISPFTNTKCHEQRTKAIGQINIRLLAILVREDSEGKRDNISE